MEVAGGHDPANAGRSDARRGFSRNLEISLRSPRPFCGTPRRVRHSTCNDPRTGTSPRVFLLGDRDVYVRSGFFSVLSAVVGYTPCHDLQNGSFCRSRTLVSSKIQHGAADSCCTQEAQSTVEYTQRIYVQAVLGQRKGQATLLYLSPWRLIGRRHTGQPIYCSTTT